VTTLEHAEPLASGDAHSHSGRRRGWLVRRALLASDLFGLVLAFSLTEAFYGGDSAGTTFGTAAEVALFIATLPLWIIVAKLYGLYDRDEERTDHTTSDDVIGVLHLTTIGTWIVFAASRLTGVADPDLARVTVFWGIAILAIVAARSLARAFCRGHESYVQNTLIVGADRVGRLIGRKLQKHPEYGLRLVGFVDEDTGDPIPGFGEDRVLGDLDNLPGLIRKFDVGRVILGFPANGHEELLGQITHLNDVGVQVDVVPRFYAVIAPGVDIHTAGGVSLISLPPLRLPRSSLLLKRSVDVIGSALALFFLAPFFLVIAALIKRDSPGPVFFRQRRMCGNDSSFRIWKFRTMTVDAEARKSEIAHLSIHAQEDGDPRMFKVEHDPRVTRVGRVLRRFSLDELPQFINVFRGEMSLVGPRPLIPEEHEHVASWRRRRLGLKPGITGLWQVNGRSELPFEEMVALDYRYVTHWSLWQDISLLFRTVPQVLRGTGAAE
jgi:exopolysaccharide biosynthesis polyprenyl glycosylphosphotransferase